MFAGENEVDSYLLVTFWYGSANSHVNEYLVLGQLVHFCFGCVLPLRIAMESVKSKGVSIVLWNFVSVHVLGVRDGPTNVVDNSPDSGQRLAPRYFLSSKYADIKY